MLRDVEGPYKKARREIANFKRISSPYETPEEAADLIVVKLKTVGIIE